MVGAGKLRSCPPLASAETLFSGSPSNGNLDPPPAMLSLQQFQRLDSEAKYAEIGRLLPLVSGVAADFSLTQQTIGCAWRKLENLEMHMEGSQRPESFKEEVVHDMPRFRKANLPESGLPSMEAPPPDPFVIARSRFLNKRVKLNVGGIRHEVLWKILEQIPHSRLDLLSKAKTDAEILQYASEYNLVDNEYFFDRHPRSFNTILNFYRTGKLHVADEMCALAFRSDLDYWGIDEAYIESCCVERHVTKREGVMEAMEQTSGGLETAEEEDFGTGKFAKHQKALWDLIEHSESSKAAEIVSIISTAFVGVSIVGMTVNTMPDLQYTDSQGNTTDNPWLALIETLAVTWFTLEYLLRFAGAPEKWKFLKDGMNIIDVISIIPFFVGLFFLDDDNKTETTVDYEGFSTTLSSISTTSTPEEEEGGIEDVLAIFRIFKLARVLKLARHSPGLQAIAYTLKHSFKELLLLVFLITISGFIFASFCYFIEVDQGSGFTSIPAGFYWVVVTMTTVGYGDIYPQTGLGKFVGTMCAVAGVLVLSLPIPIIAGNFEAFHKANQAGEKAKKRKALLLANKEKEEKEREEAVDQCARVTRSVPVQCSRGDSPALHNITDRAQNPWQQQRSRQHKYRPANQHY